MIVNWEQVNGENRSLRIEIDGTPFTFTLRPYGDYFHSFSISRTLYMRDFRLMHTGVGETESVCLSITNFLHDANRYLEDRGESTIDIPKISFSRKVSRGIRKTGKMISGFFKALNTWWLKAGIWPQVTLVAVGVISAVAPVVTKLVEDRLYDVSFHLHGRSPDSLQLEVSELHRIFYLDNRSRVTIVVPFYHFEDSISFRLRDISSNTDSVYHYQISTIPIRVEFKKNRETSSN